MKNIIVLTSLVYLVGCASADYTKAERDARSTAEAPNGPTLVSVSRYQFVPDMGAMKELCLQEYAKKNKGEPTKWKFDRNMVAGMSTCIASN